MKKSVKSLNLLAIVFSLFLVSCGSSGSQADHKTAGNAAPTNTQLTGNELTIVAHVTVKPEYKDEVTRAFKAVVDGTRKEPGNISYELLENVADPLKFTFVEVWKSQEAIDAHNQTAHFLDFVKAVDGKADLEVFILKKKF